MNVSHQGLPILCGSIAAKQGSLGARMHNAAYKALGVPHVYVPFATDDTAGAISAMRVLGMRGLSVSNPHKERVMKLLDAIDPVAKEIGAVNTVVNDDGVLTGSNVDWIGVVRALEERTSIKGKKCVVIGAGGAARAMVYALRNGGAGVVVFNRSIDKARSLCTEFGVVSGGDLTRLAEMRDYDILLNGTSIGFFNEQDCPVPPEAILPGKIVFEVVSFPARTKLLKLAEQKGCTVIPGSRMLIHQAVEQVELYTGNKAPFEVMERALAEALAEHEPSVANER